MNKLAFSRLCNRAVSILRERAPIATGNLRYNSIRYENSGPDTFTIYIDEAIAPYMPFTNEKWVDARWNGTENPHEKWFQNAAEEILNMIASEFNGEIEDDNA